MRDDAEPDDGARAGGDAGWRALLAPLARAQDALARLEAAAALASEAVREGLVARLALAEAAGWLAHQGGGGDAPVSTTDLALREAGLVGPWELLALGGYAGRLAEAMPDTTVVSRLVV